MTYRNERDALKGRVESLQEELDAAKKQLEEARRPRGAGAGGQGRWLLLLPLLFPFVLLPALVAAVGPVIAPPLGRVAGPFVCPSGYWGSYVATWQTSDGSSNSDHWELRCVFTDGTMQPAPDGPTWFALLGLTEGAMLATVGPVALALVLRRRRRQGR